MTLAVLPIICSIVIKVTEVIGTCLSAVLTRNQPAASYGRTKT
jgi:hypothetical protein